MLIVIIIKTVEGRLDPGKSRPPPLQGLSSKLDDEDLYFLPETKLWMNEH
jgi:hypothetical protein